MNGQHSTRVSRLIEASPEVVYKAFLDARAVAAWQAPDNMTAEVHAYDARPGGAFRMTLAYRGPHPVPGKSSEHSDSFTGRFAELKPFEKIVQVVEFESSDPSMAGEMTMTWSLAKVAGGTEVTVLCENIPQGIRLEDNEAGCEETLKKLAAYVE